ncbi:hypothetical protein Clacol_005899 [Clathrus columnatus]|uniref:aminomethyltransferase n=1 Tax=Clathrus columnatus TaxID=1419009 RepID=A0AAV5AEV0_9AGAM|nr:hypothetical protein Clacol_005899 [Clathrus columnatus]
MLKLVGDAVPSVEDFMAQYKMDHPAALHRLKVGVPATVEHSTEEGVETGKWVAETTQGFITFMDALKLRLRAKDQLHPLLQDLVTGYARFKSSKDWEGRSKLVGWLITLNGMKASDEISEEQSRQLRKTNLYDFHVKHKAKMVPFGGYMMPLSYGDVGQVASHHHVRNHVGLFDVGHMVQSRAYLLSPSFRGRSITQFLEYLTPSGLTSLEPTFSTLSVLLNKNGGIIDDLVITRRSDHEFYVVTNAGRRERDLGWFSQQIEIWNESRSLDDKVEMEVLEGWGLLALQGPGASQVLQRLTPVDLAPLTFGRATNLLVDDLEVHVSRGGYTGEDGFEISIPPSHTVQFAEALMKQDSVQLAGLAARDSLRLEAGMCLYGHDLDEETSPVEAGLSWVIDKKRRQPNAFIGAETVIKHLKKDGAPRRRVGLIVEGAPAREGAEIYTPDNELIGKVTSGIPSPTLNKNIAMGYVKSGWHKKGTEIQVKVRNTMRKAMVSPMPFIETKYWRG